jgi:hypothetical protein
MLRKDSLQLGIILGLLAPILGLVVVYFVKYFRVNATFTEFLLVMRDNKEMLTGVSSLSLLANVVVFTVYINSRRDKTAKGVFLSTLVYGITVLLIKVIK